LFFLIETRKRTPTKNAAAVAPSGKWYGRINTPRTCLTPHCGWTPCDINVTYTPLKSAFNGLQFRRSQYGSIFIRLVVTASETREMSQNSTIFDLTAVQGHPKSSILVSISPYVISYY